MGAPIFRPDASGSASVLGPLESTVMNAVWQIDHAVTVGDLVARLQRDGHRVHYSSAKTTLNTLTEKGYLTKRSIGRANTFTQTLSRAEFEQRLVGGVLTGLMRNYHSPLMASLAQAMAQDDDSLHEFERLLAQQRCERSPK